MTCEEERVTDYDEMHNDAIDAEVLDGEVNSWNSNRIEELQPPQQQQQQENNEASQQVQVEQHFDISYCPKFLS